MTAIVPPPVLDPARLRALRETRILDSPAEESFDRMTRLASRLLGAPVALASFVDADRQFFKSRWGEIPEPWASARQTPLTHSFCQHVVASGEAFVVEDARSHPLVKDNLAIDDLGVIAYAGTPIRAPGGEALGSFCVIDTQARSWTPPELEILRDLAASVDAEIALRMARDAAEAASRAKSEFVANMSHEIRTPMNAVIGVTEILLQTELSDEQRNYVDIIRSSGDTLLDVINDILDLSRIEAGKLDLDLAPFALDEVLAPLRALEFKARQKALTLTVQVEPDVPSAFHGDAVRIRQILINLVGNAIKFTQEGGVTLRVSRTRVKDGLTTVRFSVKDTGIGIRPERRLAIFESFSQEDGSTTRRFGGSGLGLTISRNLTAMMNGQIWVESEVGAGSEFHVELPLPASPVPGAGRAADGSEVASTAARTVLVADDNPVNQLVACKMLEKEGHRVLTAADGKEALDAMAKGGMDVVLMDIQMPGMDGLEATRLQRERELGTGRRIPIIALTAHAMAGDRERALEAGMDGYLSKPLRLDDLRGTLAGLEAAVPAPGSAPPAAAPTREALLEAVFGEEDLLRDVARLWLEGAPEFLEKMQAAVAGRDAAALETSAHRAKGAALAMGARAVADAAAVLERMGTRGEVAEAGPALERFAEATEELTRVGREVLEG